MKKDPRSVIKETWRRPSYFSPVGLHRLLLSETALVASCLRLHSDTSPNVGECLRLWGYRPEGFDRDVPMNRTVFWLIAGCDSAEMSSLGV